jgi:hypothetical protein
MREIITNESGGSGTQFICSDCGENVGAVKPGEVRGIWRGDVQVHHCDGISSSASKRPFGEPHHFTRLHPRCWKCNALLGCPRCSGRDDELLCMNGSGKAAGGFFGHDGMGPVWATPQALAAHGLLAGQSLSQYPPSWRPFYEGDWRPVSPTGIDNSIPRGDREPGQEG